MRVTCLLVGVQADALVQGDEDLSQFFGDDGTPSLATEGAGAGVASQLPLVSRLWSAFQQLVFQRRQMLQNAAKFLDTPERRTFGGEKESPILVSHSMKTINQIGMMA